MSIEQNETQSELENVLSEFAITYMSNTSTSILHTGAKCAPDKKRQMKNSNSKDLRKVDELKEETQNIRPARASGFKAMIKREVEAL